MKLTYLVLGIVVIASLITMGCEDEKKSAEENILGKWKPEEEHYQIETITFNAGGNGKFGDIKKDGSIYYEDFTWSIDKTKKELTVIFYEGEEYEETETWSYNFIDDNQLSMTFSDDTVIFVRV